MAEIFQPADLQKGAFQERGANAEPPFFAVFGKPIAHSLSPLMQNAALRETALADARYKGSQYFAFEVEPSSLKKTLSLFWEKNFCGINLTIPHKEVVMELADAGIEFDADAAMIGACNTLLKTENGWKGFNTDGFGLEKAIEDAFKKSFENADVVLIGAGGAARSAAFAAARKCKSLTIVNRSRDRLEKLVADLQKNGLNAKALCAEDEFPQIADGSIIINSTPMGLNENDAPVADFSRIPSSAVFYDMPYRKNGETVSVMAARKCGIRAESGLGMLAWQGAKALSIWTGMPLLGELMLKTLKESFNEYR